VQKNQLVSTFHQGGVAVASMPDCEAQFKTTDGFGATSQEAE